MKIINRYKLSVFLSLALLLNSCSGDWLDINQNTNNPEDADLELLIPSIQIGLAQVLVDRFETVGKLGMNYEDTSTDYDIGSETDLGTGYNELMTDVLINGEKIILDAPELDPPLTTHAGIAKIIKAFTYTTIVDLWGAAPYDEALKGANGPQSPQWEDGSQVYPKVLELINDGIADLELGAVGPQTDMIYGGDAAKWIKFANTLKLKMALNLRDAGLVTQAMQGGLLESNDDDAEVFFGGGLAPENRHRFLQLEYQSAKNNYMSNYMMYTMYKSYGDPDQSDIVDPRIRYYFYRQIDDFDAALASGRVVRDDFPCFNFGARNDQPSSWQEVCAYGYVGDGYTGRDHGDNTGIPNDGGSRATWGVYPAGGLFDDNSFKVVTQADGNIGFYPLLTYAMSRFMLAEAVLTLGVAGDARAYMEEGIRASISDVMSFGSGASNFDASLAPTSADVDAYVEAVLARYDGLPNPGSGDNANTRLDVVMEQWQIANQGNNTESYTNFRRTKLPFVRPARNLTSRMSHVPANPYPRRLPFPQVELATNANAPDPNEVLWFRDPIFWDTKAYADRF